MVLQVPVGLKANLRACSDKGMGKMDLGAGFTIGT